MNIANLLKLLRLKKINFKEVLMFIDKEYDFVPSVFRNGRKMNYVDENQGSARVLYLGKLHNLTKEETLLLFAEHYETVLSKPICKDHQNIREFMEYGWEGVVFESEVLVIKTERRS